MSDPHQGGSLEEMAPTGTSIPNDAGQQRVIPSKPRPDQMADVVDSNNLGASNLAAAADNQGDISRNTADQSATPTVLTGTGDQLPGQVGAKRLHPTPGGGPHDPASHGHPRDEKHGITKGSQFDEVAEPGTGIDVAGGRKAGKSDEKGWGAGVKGEVHGTQVTASGDALDETKQV